MRRSGWGERGLAPLARYLLFAPAAAMVIGFFAIPLLGLLRISFYEGGGRSGFGIGGATAETGGGFYREGTWTLDHYQHFFGDDYFVSILLFTAELAIIVTAVTMIVAYPMAYYIYKARPWLKTLLLIAVILPKLSNMLVLVYGLQILLATTGPVNALLLGLGIAREPVELVYALPSVVLGEVLLIAPYAILIITVALHRLDPALEGAARGLGAGPARAFLTVTLPLSLPGTLVALLVTAVWALGAFVSPVLLGNPDLQTLAAEIPKQTFENVNWAMGAAIAFVMVGLMALAVLAFNLGFAARAPEGASRR